MKTVDLVGRPEAGLPPGVLAHQLRELTLERLHVGGVARAALLSGRLRGLERGSADRGGIGRRWP